MDFEVHGKGLKRKFLAAILPSMIDQLGLGSSKKVVVISLESDCGPLGLTVDMCGIGYMVVINPKQSIKGLGLTLAHEMVHVRQMAKGIMRDTGNGSKIWAGKKYSKNTAYLDQPWELDAFARQEIILRRAVEL